MSFRKKKTMGNSEWLGWKVELEIEPGTSHQPDLSTELLHHRINIWKKNLAIIWYNDKLYTCRDRISYYEITMTHPRSSIKLKIITSLDQQAREWSWSKCPQYKIYIQNWLDSAHTQLELDILEASACWNVHVYVCASAVKLHTCNKRRHKYQGKF